MPTYPQIPLIAPTPGGSSGSWATLLNAMFLAIDSHRHEGTGAGGAKIHPASMDIDDDLSMAANSLTNTRAIAFSSGAAVSGTRRLYFGADNNLYVNDHATGTPIQITDGTSLNMAFAGGIGGDYASVSAELNYDNGGARYTLKGAAGTNWARVAAGEVRIHEHGTSNSNFIALSVPAALAVQYTLTLPGALPAAGRLMQVDAAGTVTYSNTIAAAVTMAADTSVTVSGTGDFKHGARTIALDLSAGQEVSAAGGLTYDGSVVTWTGSVSYDMPISLPAGCRITACRVYYSRDSATTLTFAIIKADTIGTTSAVVTKDIAAGSGAANTALESSPTAGSLPYTLIALESYRFRATAANADDLSFVELTFDRP